MLRQAEISALEDEGDSAINAVMARQDDVYNSTKSTILNIYNIWLAQVARLAKTVSRKDVRIMEPVEPMDVINSPFSTGFQICLFRVA